MKTIFSPNQTAYDVLHTCDPKCQTSSPAKRQMIADMQSALQHYSISPDRVHLYTLDEISFANVFVGDVAPMKQQYDPVHARDHRKETSRQTTGRYGEIAVEGMIARDFCDYRVDRDSSKFEGPDLFPLLPVGVKTAEFPKPWLINRKYLDVRAGIAETGLTPAEYLERIKTPRNPHPLIPQIIVMISPDESHERAVVFGIVPVCELVRHADDSMVMNPEAVPGKTGFNAINSAIPFHDWDSLVMAYGKAVAIDRAAGYDVYSSWLHEPERDAMVTSRCDAMVSMDENGSPVFEEIGEKRTHTADTVCKIRMPENVFDRANAAVAKQTRESGGFGGATACYERQRRELVDSNTRSFMAHMTNALRNGHDPFAAENIRDNEAKAAVSCLYSVFRHTELGEFYDRLSNVCNMACQQYNGLLASYLSDEDRVTHIVDTFQEREAEEVAQRRAAKGLPTVEDRLDQLRAQYPQAFEPLSEADRTDIAYMSALEDQADALCEEAEEITPEDWILSR